MDLTIEFDGNNNIVSICGQNNVGKTNFLRALNIFFNPNEFIHTEDVPMIKQVNWSGANVYPFIELTFADESAEYIVIQRNFKLWRLNEDSLAGQKKGTKLSHKDCETFLKKIKFYYIESINTIVPNVIKDLAEDILTVKFDKARFTKGKEELKSGYDNYIGGMEDILNKFSYSLSETFNDFRENWNISFNIPKAKSFLDMVTYDVHLTIDDKGALGINNKGSGLQRLALILLQFEIIKKLNKQYHPIVCIDEPDLFLHEGLQKKLMDLFVDVSKDAQIFLTTHSKTFVNTYCVLNSILLTSKIETHMLGKQKDRPFDVVYTQKIDLTSQDGYEKICDHLGIEKVEYELLSSVNLLVEGNCDKKIFSELADYWGFQKPNIISANGVNNVIPMLDLYDSYYKNSIVSKKPKIKVIFDNDSAGRDVYKRVKAKSLKYKFIEVNVEFLQNFDGTGNISEEKNFTNNELEDFLYPELMCTLANIFLKEAGRNLINIKTVITKIEKISYKGKGIMVIIEDEKNNQNPDENNLTFISSGSTTNNIKEQMAKLFSLKANPKLIKLIENGDKKYPFVKKELKKLLTF